MSLTSRYCDITRWASELIVALTVTVVGIGVVLGTVLLYRFVHRGRHLEGPSTCVKVFSHKIMTVGHLYFLFFNLKMIYIYIYIYIILICMGVIRFPLIHPGISALVYQKGLLFHGFDDPDS